MSNDISSGINGIHQNGIQNGNGIHPSHQFPSQNNWSKINVVLGSQWGDEGKGKIVDLLAAKADIICRCQVSICSIHY